MDHDRAVEEPVAVPQRRADDEHRQQVRGGLDERRRAPRCTASSRASCRKQVVDGVAGQAQLGEDRDRDALVVAGPRLLERLRAALVAGSAIATGSVHAATRAKPWA